MRDTKHGANDSRHPDPSNFPFLWNLFDKYLMLAAAEWKPRC